MNAKWKLCTDNAINLYKKKLVASIKTENEHYD